MSKKFVMKQMLKWPKFGCGAKGDDLVNGDDIAKEAFGSKAKNKNSGLLAFPYLWRRFGPPWSGSDDHKELCQYLLTTPDPEVWLTIGPSGSRIDLAVGYIASKAIAEERARPYQEWEKTFETWWLARKNIRLTKRTPKKEVERIADLYWKDRLSGKLPKAAIKVCGEYPARHDPKEWRTVGGLMARVNQALFDALTELKRPVFVRDVPINIFGRCNAGRENAVECSKFAGYGCDRLAMVKMMKS